MKKKIKKVSINFIVPLVLYPFHVMVSIGQSDDELGPVLDKYPLTEDDIRNCAYTSENAKGRYCRFSTNGSFIRIRNLPVTSEDYGILAHEIFHVVAGLMDLIGMKLRIMTSDEAYAYCIQYLTQEIYKKINKYY